MSEYQFIHFLAIDRPLDDKQLEYMETQSSRAEVSRWEFTNEYHYGDFRGNALEMLRRGFDVHLHFANFGIRKLMFRLPFGLPCDKKTFASFTPKFGITWNADKSGPGGVLKIQPDADAGSFDYLMNVDDYLPAIAPVHELLMAGDLRPLYLMWLACPGDDDDKEPPIPAGLDSLPECLLQLAEFYEVGDDLLAAAAQLSPPAPTARDELAPLKMWVDQQSVDELRSLVTQLLSKDAADARVNVLSQVRKDGRAAEWPVAEPNRTWSELRTLAEKVGEERQQKKEKAAATARKKLLSKIAANPNEAIEEAKRLVATRVRANYDKAAQRLADLRDALGPERGTEMVQLAAQDLRQKNTSCRGLIPALEKHKLLRKGKK